MRTIKFRAKSLCKGEDWVYGDLVHYNRNPHTEKWTIHEPDTGIGTDIDETTIGQFTGLFDKNGKEIYEGDIVYVNDWTSVYKKPYRGVVKFVKCCWVVKYKSCSYTFQTLLEFDDFSDRKTEVIDNIHNNPELLKGEMSDQ